MSVLEGVEADLRQMPDDLRNSGLAAVARAMASRIDAGSGSPSECGKVLIEALTKLRDLKPPEDKKGQLHDIKSGRALRLAPGSSAG